VAKILIVDDEALVRDLESRICSAAGHECEAFGSVAEALSAFGNAKFDLVITDMNMPDRTGLDLLRRLREDGSTVPVICVSGSVENGDTQDLLAYGFSSVVQKPATLEQLQEAIDSALE